MLPRSPRFGDIRSVALVRWNDRGAQRAKDPLDAVAETVAARHVESRVLELTSRVPEQLRGAERLYEAAEARVVAAPGVGGRGRVGERLGDAAAREVRALGVDAVVLYLRLENRFRSRRDAREVYGPEGVGRDPMLGSTASLSRFRRVGAVAVVGSDGALVWFDWGPWDERGDPPLSSNAAEAVDAAMRALFGEEDDEG